MDMLKIDIDEEAMRGMSKARFKSIVRKHVISATFTSFKTIQLSHTKVRNIHYPSFVLQPYFQSELFDHEEISLLLNMKADTIKGFKMCFQSAHREDCNYKDSIKHAFECHEIKKHIKKNGNVTLKRAAVTDFIQIQNIQQTVLASSAYQGHILDTATPASAGEAGGSQYD